MKLNQRNVQVILAALGIDSSESQRRAFLKRFHFSEVNPDWPIQAFSQAIGGRAHHLLARIARNYVKRERITITFCAPEQHVIRAPNKEAVARNWMVYLYI